MTRVGLALFFTERQNKQRGMEVIVSRLSVSALCVGVGGEKALFCSNAKDESPSASGVRFEKRQCLPAHARKFHHHHHLLFKPEVDR
jgi:hypothetical protein